MRHVLLCLLAALSCAGEPAIRRDADTLTVDLGNGAVLAFALAGDRLLGLRTATSGGMPLKSPSTRGLPLVAGDDGDRPWVADDLRLRDAEVADGAVRLRLDLRLAAADGWRRWFMAAPDLAWAEGEGLTPELARLRDEARAAEAEVAAAIAANPEHQALVAAAAALERELAAKPGWDPAKPPKQLRQAREAPAKAEPKLRDALLAAQPALRARIAAWPTARAARGLANPKVHRDYHTFPMLRLPAEVCAAEMVAALPDGGAVVGELVWTIRPDHEDVAGWRWSGWRWEFTASMAASHPLRALRFLGTWELGGDPVGATLVGMRFRGLGGIAQTVRADSDGAVAEAWSTTETIPGAVGNAPVIAPAPPSSLSVSDRGFGLKHRAGAWIARLGRGAGAPFVDWQQRSEACFAAFPVRQGDLRTLTECYPGDRAVSQTDEEWFARGRAAQSTAMRYLVLPAPAGAPFAEHELRSRWGEVDRHVRDAVAAELGFVQFDPVPAQGFIVDGGWSGWLKDLAKALPRYRELGIRSTQVHNPGWINGRYQGPDGPPRTGGGVCLVYDWMPTADCAEPWRQLQREAARFGIGHYVWIGTYNWWDAPWPRSVVAGQSGWAVKNDGITTDDNAGVWAHDYTDAAQRAAITSRLEACRRDFGFQGFWVDSFQSTAMHRFSRPPAQRPNQRATWELLAEWSRKGVGFIAESTAFPGWNCSIELPGAEHGFEGQWWYLNQSTLWYRAVPLPGSGTPAADRFVFRCMANGAWPTTQEHGVPDPARRVPSHQRLAHEYLAALAAGMHRAFILPGEGGVLWLSAAGDTAGTWFSFSDQAVPAGVAASGILDGAAADTALAHRTYRVQAPDLPAAFGLRRGPLPDGRIGRPPVRGTWTWPEAR